MDIALHSKLTSNDYLTSFIAAQTHILATADNSDDFKLMYRLLEIIHPKLRAA